MPARMTTDTEHSIPVPLIHVGFPKAISSWLQKHYFQPACGFFKILDSLETQLTIIKPSPFHFDASAAQRTLAQHAHRGVNGAIPVITAEALSGNMYCGGFDGHELAQRIKAVAPQARLLLMVREQRSLIRSLYKSWIVWGMPHSIERMLQPLTPDLAPQFNLDFLRFDQRITCYQQLFGRDNVLVIPYEAFRQEPIPVLQRIHRFAQAPEATLPVLHDLPVRKRVNRGTSLAWLYWLRLQNRWLYATPFNYSGLLPADNDRLMKRLTRSKKNPLPRFTDAWFEKSFQTAVAALTQGQFADSNRRLAELTGLDLARYGYEL